jgi:hypothetical protein
MGASGWAYYAPYQEDLAAALNQLRDKAFREGEYYWDPSDEHQPRPTTIEELWSDERVQESGTHGILDMFRVLGPSEMPDYCTVRPVSADEALRAAGTDRLTREHVKAIDHLADQRWHGRCAVLHDPAGNPSELYFWGFSGD